jgi:nucleoside-diphosphate-sugar epimerase
MAQDDFLGPVNIGSEEMVTINSLVQIVSSIADKDISIKHIPGPLGVRGRNSDNSLIREKLGWDYSMSLEEGLSKTYNWINNQVKK